MPTHTVVLQFSDGREVPVSVPGGMLLNADEFEWNGKWHRVVARRWGDGFAVLHVAVVEIAESFEEEDDGSQVQSETDNG